MNQEVLMRLEALKLAHRHDRSPTQVLDVAKIYEDYILGDSTEVIKSQSQSSKKGSESKKVGNPII